MLNQILKLYIFISFKMNTDSNLAEMVVAIMVGCLTIAFFFVFCEFGDRVERQFNAINEEFYKCNWHLLPFEMHQMLAIFLLGIKQPVIIRGYGNTQLTRVAFRKVRLRVYSESIFSINFNQLNLFVIFSPPISLFFTSRYLTKEFRTLRHFAE